MPTTTAPTPTCAAIRLGQQTQVSPQGLTYHPGISAQSAGARGICMHLLRIPPGGRAKAHYHAGHETAIYTLSGETDVWYGDGLAQHLVVRAGEFFYIPPGMPHLPVNLSATQPCECLVARTDANEHESVVLLPELDAVVDRLIRQLSASSSKSPAAP